MQRATPTQKTEPSEPRPPDRHAGIPAPEIRAALAKILASETFAKAQRMSRLLRFLIENGISGDARKTSEYAIGIGVFDRMPDTYSPGEDPIVRVQIGRLREKLKAYYAGPGRDCEIRISIPVGTYMPVIRCTVAGKPGCEPSPILAIFPLKCITPDPEAASFTHGLSEELTYQLFKEFKKKFILRSHIAPHGGHESDPATTLASQSGSGHLLWGSVRVEGEFIRTSMRLIDAPFGHIAWSEQFDRVTSLSISNQESLAFTIRDSLKNYLGSY